MKNLLLEKIEISELQKYIKDLYAHLKSKMKKIDRDPRLFFVSDKENANDMLGKTGYYDPDREEIHLFITDRHAKDILRSFAHEVVHHEQKCSGFSDTLNLSNTSQPDYASKDPGLRKAEKDAFLRGNMLFRDWTDSLKVARAKEQNIMAEEIDKKKSDLNKDGKLSGYEKKRGAAIAKSMKKSKKDVEEAKDMAKKEARKAMQHYRGKDVKKEQEAKENLEEQKLKNLVKELVAEVRKEAALERINENKAPIDTPYPVLFEKKERILSERFTNKDNIVYEELLKRFGIKNG